ncbi:MAG: type II toxin-antitoxin system PemK/MazF family toxin [Microthrixaceae bacterium]
MVARGDVVWADLGPPAGRRPVCVLTRDAAIGVLGAVVCAPLTRTVRGIRSEVPVRDRRAGIDGVVNCDTIFTLPLDRLDPDPATSLDLDQRLELDRALRWSLDILG